MKLLLNIHSKFLSKVATSGMPQFELKNEFPDQTLQIVWSVGTKNGQVALVHPFDIRVKVGMILIMGTTNMPERCDSKGE